MSERDEYPAGVPCWVETLQPDAQAARDFYGALFGWEFAGPIDARPAGRLVVLADPAGAAIGVWEAADREGAQVVNEPRAWAMSMLHTPDPEGALAFYGDVFGWEHERFDAGGAQVTLWRLPGYVGGEPQQPVPRDVVGAMGASAAGQPPHWSVDFWVADAEATAEQAGELGGAVVAGPFDMPPFKRAVIADPQGATFSVSQLVSAPG